VTEATRQCLEVIAKHDMVLATSHIRPAEMLPVVRAARAAGVQRIVVTHPEFPTTLLPIDLQRELAGLGCYFERCYTTPATGKISWEQVYENIRQVGPETTIVATDLGQATAPYPDEGLAIFVGNLLDNGFSSSDIRRMVRDNAAQLLGG
jgi:predicted metal-dependent TIM-barrel fold hydrolase